MFLGQHSEKPVFPESSVDGQLACRWLKVNKKKQKTFLCLIQYATRLTNFYFSRLLPATCVLKFTHICQKGSLKRKENLDSAATIFELCCEKIIWWLVKKTVAVTLTTKWCWEQTHLHAVQLCRKQHCFFFSSTEKRRGIKLLLFISHDSLFYISLIKWSPQGHGDTIILICLTYFVISN